MADATRMDGVLIINKAPNMTSAETVAAVKRLLTARKVGHTGTLDPFATGVLVCCINRATRLARFFLAGGKTYLAVLHLGIETDTHDATGQILARHPAAAATAQQVERVCRQFEGEYWQSPPRYSALKHQGKPLYRYAREGEPVQKPPRRVEIEAIRLQDVRPPLVRFEVACSSGTYVRTLCHDMGNALGCGGHLKELMRVESSGFRLEEAVSLFRLRRESEAGIAARNILTMASALRGVPEIIANKALTERIKHGRVVTRNEIVPSTEYSRQGLIKVVDEHHHLIAVLGHRKQRQEMKYHCVFN